MGAPTAVISDFNITRPLEITSLVRESIVSQNIQPGKTEASMSGIEVAGLVLGGFPLLISVLEHYRQGWETLEDWFEIKTQYKKSRQDIDTQQAIFEDNLERLLGTLVRNDDHLKALLAEPGGDQWRDVALDEGLRARLPRSYDVYLRTVSEINSIMDGLKHQLGDGLVSFQSKVACEIVSVSAGS